MIHSIQHCLVKMAYLILQPFFIDRTQLFQQDHRVLLNSIRRSIDLNMRRQLCLIHLRSNRSTDDRGTVSVAHIILNDKDWSDPTLLGTDHRSEICIVDITASDHQFSSLRSVLFCSQSISCLFLFYSSI